MKIVGTKLGGATTHFLKKHRTPFDPVEIDKPTEGEGARTTKSTEFLRSAPMLSEVLARWKN